MMTSGFKEFSIFGVRTFFVEGGLSCSSCG
jgi:hypothetical protein